MILLITHKKHEKDKNYFKGKLPPIEEVESFGEEQIVQMKSDRKKRKEADKIPDVTSEKDRNIGNTFDNSFRNHLYNLAV